MHYLATLAYCLAAALIAGWGISLLVYKMVDDPKNQLFVVLAILLLTISFMLVRLA